MSRFKRMSLWAGTAALIAGTGIKNLLLPTLLVVGTPATTAGFVYEVLQLRQAQLKREADDRNGVTPSHDAASAEGIAASSETQAGSGPDVDGGGALDLPHKLASMVIAREHFLDLYAANVEAGVPVYQGLAKSMLADDERMIAQLETLKLTDGEAGPAEFRSQLTKFRDLHRRLAKLAAPQIAADIGVPVLK